MIEGDDDAVIDDGDDGNDPDFDASSVSAPKLIKFSSLENRRPPNRRRVEKAAAVVVVERPKAAPVPASQPRVSVKEETDENVSRQNLTVAPLSFKSIFKVGCESSELKEEQLHTNSIECINSG